MPLPELVYAGHQVVLWNSRLYVIGGLNFNASRYPDTGLFNRISSAVYYADINADGTLTPWQQTYLPFATHWHGAAVWNGYLYITGGGIANGAGSVVGRNVVYAPLNADGSLGAWQTGPDMPCGLWAHSSVAAGNMLYISGGATWDPCPRDQITDAVYGAQINPDGSLGAWQSQPSMPAGRAIHAMNVRHGLVYVTAGQEPLSPSMTVYSAAINSDGSLQSWAARDFLPEALTMHAGAAGNDSIYVLGGRNGNSMFSTVNFLPDSTAPDAVTTADAAAINSSSIQLDWTATGNDGAFGTVQDGQFEIRYSVNASDFVSFESIPNPVVLPANFDPGDAHSHLVSGLAAGTTYYFGIKTVDRAGNRSALSNIASARTMYLAVGPEVSPKIRLESFYSGISITVVPEQDSAVALQSAPGTLVSSVYDISPSVSLSPDGILTFVYDAGVDTANLAIYQFIDSTVGWSSAPITAQVIDAGNLTISGRISGTSIYALFIPKKPAPPSSDVAVEVHPETLLLPRAQHRYYDDFSDFLEDLRNGHASTLALVCTGEYKHRGKGRAKDWSKKYSCAKLIRKTLADLIRALRGKRHGRSITAYFESLGFASVADIDPASVKLVAVNSNAVGPIPHRGSLRLGDGNSNGVPDLTLKFDRERVSEVLSPGDATLTFEGRFRSGASFRAEDTIRVIQPPSGKPRSVAWNARYWPAPENILKLRLLDGATVQAEFASWLPKKAKGRKWSRERLAVHVPDDALPNPSLEVSITTGTEMSWPGHFERKLAAEKVKITAVGDLVDFGPEGTRFAQAITIEFPYNRSLLPPGVKEDNLAVYWWNPSRREWEKMPSTVDKLAQMVRAQTDHFSLYGLFSGGAASSAEGFSFGEVYAYPNPARPGQTPKIRAEAAGADSLQIRVYDVSGELKHSAEVSGGSADHAVGNLVSGVYVFTVTANKSGQGSIRTTGRLAVIR